MSQRRILVALSLLNNALKCPRRLLDVLVLSMARLYPDRASQVIAPV